MNIFCKGIKKLSDYVTFPCDSTGDIPQSLNLSIFQFSVSQIFSFSDSILGVPATPSGFPLYLCSLSPAPVPKSRSRTKIPFQSPNPAPEKLAKDAAPIPNAEGRQQDNYITSSYSP